MRSLGTMNTKPIVFAQRTQMSPHTSVFGGETRHSHHKVKPTMIRHWLNKVMELSGVDITIFSAYPTRGASTSYASIAGVSVGVILKAIIPTRVLPLHYSSSTTGHFIQQNAAERFLGPLSNQKTRKTLNVYHLVN